MVGRHARSLSTQGAVFIGTFVWIFVLSTWIGIENFNIGVDNFWFDGDIPRYICQMVDRVSNDHWRNNVHPLFSFIVFPLVNLLTAIGIPVIVAIKLQVAGVAAVGALFLYKCFRLVGTPPVASVLLIGIVLTTSTCLTWFTVPESYAYSFAGLSFLLFLTLKNKRAPVAGMTWVGAVAFTFSVLVTNGAIGALALLNVRGMRKAVQLMILAVAIVTGLAVLQRLMFPSSGIFFLPSLLGGERSFIIAASLERLRQVVGILFFGSVVFPDIEVLTQSPGESALTVQSVTWIRGGVQALAPLMLWAVTVGAGTIVLTMQVFTHARTRKLNVAPVDETHGISLEATLTLASSLLFMLILHIFYGTETFLYTGCFLPFLMVLAAVGIATMSRRRPAWTIGFLILSLALTGWQNLASLTNAVDRLHDVGRQTISDKALARKSCDFVKRPILASGIFEGYR